MERNEDRSRVVNYLSRLYGSVKDKNQQVSLFVEDIVEECLCFMSGIHKLVIQDIIFFDRKIPSMSVFCNIYDLHLNNLDDLDSLDGLSGIKTLHVSYCDCLVTLDVIPGLQVLIVDSLTELFFSQSLWKKVQN